MDWRRAKTILILIFLVLDLFLGYQWWEYRSVALEEALLSRDQDYLQAAIKIHQITMETPIPTEKPKLSYLNVTYDTAELMYPHEGRQMIKKNDYTLIGFLSPHVPIASSMNVADLPELLAETIPNFTHYKFYQGDLASGEIRYVQQFEGYPIFGANVTLFLEDNMIQKFQQTYLKIGEKGNARDLLSASASLQNLLDQQIINDGSTILKIELGYLGQPFTQEIKEQVFVPVWKIILMDQTIYVNAVTGLVENRPALDQFDMRLSEEVGMKRLEGEDS